jgi:cytoskeleton protein RodZ
VADIGNRLREARIRKGLTIKDVETVTKIRAKYLEALEQDDFSVLPGPTFVSAFLRTYASFLKVDGEALVEEYKRHHEPRREEPTLLHVEPARGSRPGRGSAERKKRKTRRIQRGYILVGILAIVAIALLAWWGTGFGRQRAATLQDDSIEISTTTTVAGGESTTTLPGSKESTTTSAAVVTGENITVVITVAKGSCWMVVREDSQDGAELYAGTLSQNGKKTFDSSKRYYMNVGAPEALAMTINGKTVTLPTAAGAFLVTEAGIQTSQ